ncbi:entericidin EcnA/B family protein [Thalassobius sp. I31.1]|nr:entericidin EcnA/B family protein [Thalassobius sp. I31.1]
MLRITLISIALCLSACGTVEGIGEDISSGSRTVKGWF